MHNVTKIINQFEKYFTAKAETVTYSNVKSLTNHFIRNLGLIFPGKQWRK